MYSLRTRVWAGIALGLGSLNTSVPAQAAPTGTAKTAPAPNAKKAHPAKKSDKKIQILPMLIGGEALFTLLPTSGVIDPRGLTTGLPGAADRGTTPGALNGATATTPSHNGAANPSVTSVPETAPWVAFALTGLGSVGLAVRARKRLVKMS